MALISQRAHRALLASAAIGVMVSGWSSAAASAPDIQVYDLKSQSLDDALHAVAVQSGRAILAPSRLVAGKRAPALKGAYTALEAFKALLVGSHLETALVGDTVVIRDPRDPPGPGDAPAQAAEVVVTGSHIHGGQPAAPVHMVSRSEIEQSGYSQVGDVVRSLPENFEGGQNPGVMNGAGVSNVSNQNTTNASSLNLRGLGSDATLVLVDGHRLAADGAYQAADISAIPLGAVERIEIVTDGASALYGSDAVGGVANFILRKTYDGADFSERIGGAPQGGGFEQTYSALGGKTWDSGHLLASIEYSHQDAVSADQRSFTSGAYPNNDLLQAQTRVSFFTNASQDLTSWASFHIDGLVSNRRTGDFVNTDNFAEYGFTAARSYLAAPGLSFRLPGAWSANLDGSLSGTQDYLSAVYDGGGFNNLFRNSNQSVEAGATGPLVTLPSGALKLAVGAGYRDEHFGIREDGVFSEIGSRTVSFVYGEAFAPLVAPSDDRLGLNALDLTAAARLERYSDFGSTTNPKVGVRYVPVPGVTLRATWGASFKAPQFIQETQPSAVWLYPAAQVGGGAAGTALLTYGGTSNLKPERSTSWTAGVDWSPPFLSATKVSLTYFRIDYTGRIVQPVNDVGTALSDPDYAPFVIFNPTPAQLSAAVAASSQFNNLTGAPYNASQVVALIEDRYLNAVAQKIDGLDLAIKTSAQLPRGALDAFINVSWLHIVQQTAASTPQVALTGTLFNPPTLRLRSGLTWAYGAFTSTGIVNFVAGESDVGVYPTVPIGSWTTLDLNLAYRFAPIGRRLPRLEASLSITNLLDADPPYARGASANFPGINYDSTNASALGRFVALTLKQRF